MRTIPYPHPGSILLHEFLEPMGITQYRLAKSIAVPQRRIGEIVAGTRAVTVDFWVGLQLDYDTARVKDRLAPTLAEISPWEMAA